MYLALWIGGIGSYTLWTAPPEDMPWTAPLFLLLAGMIVLFTARLRDWWWLFLAGTVGFASEVVGVWSGVIFSGYRYTDALSPSLFDVPLVMVCAWFVLIAYTRQMAFGFRVSHRLKIVVAAAWMTAIDLVIDPLAGGPLGYWQWFESGFYYGIPAHNFAGWFVVSLLIFSLIRTPWSRNTWAQHTGLSVILFFTAIAWVQGLILVGVIGIALCALHACGIQVARNFGDET